MTVKNGVPVKKKIHINENTDRKITFKFCDARRLMPSLTNANIMTKHRLPKDRKV